MMVFDFEKLPRPDRHGGLGVFVMLNLLYFILSPIGGGSDLVCGMMPWKCSDQASAQEGSQRLRYAVHFLHFAPSNRATKKASVNVCHWDIKNRDGSIWHFMPTQAAAFWIEGDVPRMGRHGVRWYVAIHVLRS